MEGGAETALDGMAVELPMRERQRLGSATTSLKMHDDYEDDDDDDDDVEDVEAQKGRQKKDEHENMNK